MTANYRAIFGLVLLAIWATLIVVIAIGKVEAQTSYGLLPCITALTALSTQWANSKPEKPPEKPPTTPTEPS